MLIKNTFHALHRFGALSTVTYSWGLKNVLRQNLEPSINRLVARSNAAWMCRVVLG